MDRRETVFRNSEWGVGLCLGAKNKLAPLLDFWSGEFPWGTNFWYPKKGQKTHIA